MTHVSMKWVIISSGNVLSPVRWTTDVFVCVYFFQLDPWEVFNRKFEKIWQLFKKMNLKMLSIFLKHQYVNP